MSKLKRANYFALRHSEKVYMVSILLSALAMARARKVQNKKLHYVVTTTTTTTEIAAALASTILSKCSLMIQR